MIQKREKTYIHFFFPKEKESVRDQARALTAARE